MLKHYLKTAVKVFLRRKFFTFISLFGISLTLVVLMVATAMLDNVFGPVAPETRLDRSLGVRLASLHAEHMTRSGFAGYKLLTQTVVPMASLPSVERVSIYTLPTTVTSFHEGRKLTPFLKRTDAAFWQVMDFRFLEGGPFTEDDERNATPVAVLNEATRRAYFGDAPAVGKTIEADGQRFRVVGVVPNVPILRIVPFSDIWVPLSTAKSDAYKTELVGNLMATIVAKRRADLPGLREEFAARLARVPPEKPFTELWSGAETTFESAARLFSPGDQREAHAVGFGLFLGLAAILFMVLPTINLVNLNVSRILERASEIGVRKAFGASSRTLVGQFVTENVLLCLLGGAIGFVLSLLALDAITRTGIIPYAEFHLNLRVFAWGLLFAVFFGVFSGVYPAWKMSRLNPVEALRGRSR